MKTPLDVKTWKVLPPALGCFSLLLMTLVVLSGCEAPSGAPGSRPGSGSSVANMPGRPGGGAGLNRPGKVTARPGLPGAGTGVKAPTGEIAAPILATDPAKASPEEKPNELAGTVTGVNPLAPIAKVEQAGNTVELASTIIVSKANPFLDWLPKPLLTELTPVTPGNPTPTVIVDPFADVSLRGVISHTTSPMALVAVGTEQSQFVRKGALLQLASASAKVTAIRQDGIDLMLTDGSKQTRTLTLPNIIGYAPSGTSGAGTAGANPSAARPNPTPPAMPQGMGATNPSANLGNLKKLIEQSEGQASMPERPKKGALVDLKEP